jgi:hypothetical protein
MEREGLPDVIVYPQQQGEADDKLETEGEHSNDELHGKENEEPNEPGAENEENLYPLEIIAPQDQQYWFMKTARWKQMSIIGIELIGLYGIVLDIMIFSEKGFTSHNEMLYIIVVDHFLYSIYSVCTIIFAEMVYRMSDTKPIYIVYLIYAALNLSIGVLSIFKRDELYLNNLTPTLSLLLASIYLHLLLALFCMIVLVLYHCISVNYCQSPT